MATSSATVDVTGLWVGGLLPMTSAFAILTIMLTLCYLAIQAVLHTRTSGHSPVRNAVSDYGVGPTAPLFRAAGIANTGALIALAITLRAHHQHLHPHGIALLVITAAARVAVAILPTDVPGTSRTITGRLHLLAAVIQFAALYSFLSENAHLIAAGSDVAGILHVLVLVTLIGLIGVCCGLIIPALRGWFGLVERIFLYASSTSIACCALATLTH